RSSGGSSSTTMAMFFIASRKRCGIDASASATCRSNSFRCTGLRDHETEVIALVADDALIAERFGTADAPAVENQRVGGARPAFLRHRVSELLLDEHRIVALGDANPVRDAENVAIDGQSGHTKRVTEYDVGRLAPDARQLDERLHGVRHLAAVMLDE